MLGLIVGPSAVGKTVVLSRLVKLPLTKLFQTVTDRNVRKEELDPKTAKQYRHYSKEDFKKAVEQGIFFEHVEFAGNHYGTIREDIEMAVKDNRIWIGVVDTRGALSIKEKYPEITSIFLCPTSVEQLVERIRTRKSETEEEISKRINIAKKEIDEKDLLDKVIVNKNLTITVLKIYIILLYLNVRNFFKKK